MRHAVEKFFRQEKARAEDAGFFFGVDDVELAFELHQCGGQFRGLVDRDPALAGSLDDPLGQWPLPLGNDPRRAVGTGLAGTENRLIITYGDAQRPATTADLNLSFFPTEKLTVVNNTSVDNTRIVGNSFFEQFDLAGK